MIQSCRGTFGSGGAWEPLRHEESDGHATLSWVASQSWFDGRLVTWGASYLGMTQWAVAADPPEFLKAMALDVTAANARDAFVYPGGRSALKLALAGLPGLPDKTRNSASGPCSGRKSEVPRWCAGRRNPPPGQG